MKKTSLIPILFVLMSFVSSPSALAKVQGVFLLGGHGGMGSMGDGGTNPNRTMSNFGAHAMPALKINKFIVGPMAQYLFIGQITDPSALNDVNLGGSGYFVGAGAGFYVKRFLIRAAYDFQGSNTSSVLTDTGKTLVYQKGTGITAMVSYNIKANSRVWLDLYVSQHSFKEQSIDGTITNLSASPMKMLLYSVGLTFQLGSLSK